MLPSKDTLDRCRACSLHEQAKQSVPGIGRTKRPLLMIIGDAPGAAEDQEGIPFIGTGVILQDILTENLGLTLEDIYLTTIVKHKPHNNVAPTSAQISVCYDKWLREEITTVNPYAIIALGRCAGDHLVRFSGQVPQKTRTRGAVTLYGCTPVYHTWHPNYIMHQHDLSESHYLQAKAELTNDLRAALTAAMVTRISSLNAFSL